MVDEIPSVGLCYIIYSTECIFMKILSSRPSICIPIYNYITARTTYFTLSYSLHIYNTAQATNYTYHLSPYIHFATSTTHYDTLP